MMKIPVILLAGVALLSVSSAKANIIYDVNLTVGAGGVTGTITTNGDTGVLSDGDITAWDLTVTGGGGATLNLSNGNSGVFVGNNLGINNGVGTPDLTASLQDISFDFDATDGGYLLFQESHFNAQSYWAAGAHDNYPVIPGLSVAPVSYEDASYIDVPESGTQIIATAQSSVPDATATMPLLGLGMGALAFFGRHIRKLSVAG